MTETSATASAPATASSRPAWLTRDLALEIGAVLLIIAVAVGFRVFRLDESPPGLYYDEAYEGLDALAMLRGHTLPVFFPANFGREPLFMWMLALSQGVFGATPMVMRLTAVAVGTLTVPFFYLAARELFGRRVALLSASVLAILLWHVVASRTALRLITLPLLEVLTVWLAARAIRTGSAWAYLLAGAALGGCLYTYTAARLFPMVITVGLVGLIVTRHRLVVQQWRPMLFFPLAAALIVIPIGLYFVQNPEAFFGRIEQVAASDDASPDPTFGPGDPGTARENQERALGMYLIAGDQNLRTNLPGAPVFGPLLGAAFVIGILAAVANRRWRAGSFVLGWLVLMTLPTALSTYAPNYSRAVGALPAACLLAGLGLAAVWSLLGRLGRVGSATGGVLAVAVLVWAGWQTYNNYFERWANDLGTFRAYDVGIFDLGTAMAALDPSVTLYSSPIPGNHPTLSYASGRRDIRGYDGRYGLVLSPDKAAYGLVVGVDKTSEAGLGDAYPGATPSHIAFDPGAQPFGVLTPVQGNPKLPKGAAIDVELPGIATLAVAGIDLDNGWPGAAAITWRVIAPTEQPLTVFVQVQGPPAPGDGIVWSQWDREPVGGSYPTTRWHAGELVIDRVTLPRPNTLVPGEYHVVAGLYDRRTGKRVIASTGADQITIWTGALPAEGAGAAGRAAGGG